MKKTLKAAFPVTIPILAGFLFLGMAYGILITSNGFGILFSIGTSLFVFAGSLQFVGVTFLTSAFNPLNTFLMSIMINARHIFYGIALIDKFKDIKKEKPVLIFTLCDETFSVICNTDPPEGVKKSSFYLAIGLLDYSYWIIGTTIGAVFGQFIPFSTEGIDFSLTALFVVIFINQWKECRDHIPAVLGIVCSVICLLLFGQSKFIIPSMLLILTSLVIYRKPFERRLSAND